MPAPRRKNHSRARQVYTYTQTIPLGNLSIFGQTDPTPGGTASYSVRLADLPDGGILGALYDMYKIEHVTFSFSPTSNQSNMINATEPPGGTNPAYYLPNLHTSIDYGTNTPPTSAVQLMGASTYKRTLLDKERHYRFRPKFSLQAVQPGTITPTVGLSYSDTWCSTADPGLRWGTLRVWADPVSNASVLLAPCEVRVYAKVTIRFKNVL